MQRIAARRARGLEHAVDVEIGRGAAPAQRLRGIGLAHVQRARLVLGEDGDTAQPARRRGAHHADRDLPAVGDEQALERHGLQRYLNSERVSADPVP
jgi:hypothetical protein